jgi:nicotinamide-nucleotide amidase
LFCFIFVKLFYLGENRYGGKNTKHGERPLQNAPFCPITASGSNFNPRNIQYIPPVEICLDEDAGIKLVRQIGKLLCRQNASIAIAESCTGGLISHMITNVPGSSDYFLLSGVTYSNEAKVNLLGVSPETIKQYGAVHEETAKEMAQGVRRIAGATYGLSTSGIAGPGGATDDKPVGTVCIGLATPKYVKGYRFNFAGNDRLTNKKIFAMKALDLLRTELLEQN